MMIYFDFYQHLGDLMTIGKIWKIWQPWIGAIGRYVDQIPPGYIG
jgi:hypothetical protein